MSKFKRKRVDFAVFISVLEIETFNDENLKQIRSISSKLRPVWRPQIFLQAKLHIHPPPPIMVSLLYWYNNLVFLNDF